ncbi:MAG: 7-carboxy-7-deazaguanine synthase QueE [Elusimicrobia bacterium]|nr:7-carboxy-7-deazaguanine synthase QueE [Elusimicrobiota bacterium]
MAKIIDIFSSIQGEGIYCGQKQIFVRFAGCNLRCSYCDEPHAWTDKDVPETKFQEALRRIADLSIAEKTKDVSLTGGEPLLNPNFAARLSSNLKSLNFKVHLETNATLVSAFEAVADIIDVVAADIKLPSACGLTLWDLHGDFLSIAPEKIFVKIVLTSETGFDEIIKAVEIIENVSEDIPLFLQPVTERVSALDGRRIEKPPEEFLKRAYDYCRIKINRVEILPQRHPTWGVK